MLAVELTIPSGEKTVICTCYRVSALGVPNHDRIVHNIRSMFGRRRPPKVHIIGDFNIGHIDWDNLTTSVPIEGRFVDSFCELGLRQLIREPTHILGNILDLLLTNSESYIDKVIVHDSGYLCQSDHFAISFSIKVRVDLKKARKRSVYNFKKGDLDGLNTALRQTNWNSIINCPDNGWERFKAHLFFLVDMFIPTITIKYDSKQAPWFDSEAYCAWRKKEQCRTKYNRTKSLSDGLKYALARKTFKQVLAQKKRDNMVDSEDTNIITKKFWSYVKAVSKSSRIPDCLKRGDIIRHEQIDQANLFNDFFCDQFSDPSSYDIDIDSTDDSRFHINFDHLMIRKLLKDVNSNKAQGPSGIHGTILKKCAVGLAYPLSRLFHLSYITGKLPEDGKMANVVPVHKKR
jgi:hypothetical protein